jgi:hypothetical protein
LRHLTKGGKVDAGLRGLYAGGSFPGPFQKTRVKPLPFVQAIRASAAAKTLGSRSFRPRPSCPACFPSPFLPSCVPGKRLPQEMPVSIEFFALRRARGG